MAKKGRSTQNIVNLFPSWANIRVDEQSLGYQFINTIGLEFDDLRKQISRISDNYFLPTAIVSDIDVYYRMKLDNDFEFVKQDNDDTSFLYTPPVVSGFVGTTSYEVTIASNNDIQSFWYDLPPDRLSLITTVNGSHFIASGYANSSPLNPLVSSLHIPNHITVKVDDGSSFIGVMDNGIIRRGLVHLEGKSREGEDITEDLIFIHNETQKTFHEFSEIYPSGIKIYGLNDPDVTTVTLTSAGFNLDDYPIGYDLDVTVNKDDMPLFWSLGSGVSVKTLDLDKYDADDLELRVDGFTDKSTILQQELLDLSGSNITPLDLAVEPHSDRLWIVDTNKLYVYDNSLPYPDTSSLSGKDYNAASVIEPNTYFTVLGEEVEINYIWRRAVTGFVAHRAWVIYPNGTKYSLESGTETAYHTDSSSWIYGEPVSRQIRPAEFYTLSNRGDYVFCLEVKYTDGTKSIDKRIVSVLSKTPQAEFSLSTLGINNAIGIDIDSEYNLWILDNNGIKYKIDKHYDKMMIDFSRKIIYFREPYTKVHVY